MSYNSELQNNNAELQEILDEVNNLPDAGESVTDAVRYTAQTLTEAQKAQARENIGAIDETKLAEELAKRGQLAPEYANSIEECTDTTKMYVLPDGFIYAYRLTEKEVETAPTTGILPEAIMGSDQATGWVEGEGYTANARLSGSGGNVVAGYTAVAGVCVSGYIPVSVGDVVRIKNFYGPDGVSTYVVSYNSGKTRLTSKSWAFTNASEGYAWGEGVGAGDWYSVEGDKLPSGITTFTITEANFGAGVAFIRFSGVFNFNGENTIVTVNEEIKEGGTEIVLVEGWANTGLAFAPADYESRIIDLENDVSQNAKDIENLKRGITNATDITEWDAPIYDANISVFELSAEKAAMTNAACTPSDIYAKYDELMARHPHYITKTDLGLCSDGVNHVYRYDFREPDSRHTSGMSWSETKTKAIIVSGIHFEWSGIYGLYYALEEIADNPELFALRRNTHLIVVPCMNPYCTIAANYDASIGVLNANGVQIHRNFEVGFIYPDQSGYVEAGNRNHGGTEPLSEVETQYVDNIMKNNTDAAFFLTCHNFGDTSFNFIWPSVATPYMCNMGYRLIDKLSNVWMAKYGDELVGLEDYRTDDIPSWDNRLGFAHISQTPGTETRQATKYGIQGANVEINGRFWVHGTKANPEPSMSAFTMSRGAEVYVNFLLTAFGVYDPKDKKLYGGE
jgi:hypothetical protein